MPRSFEEMRLEYLRATLDLEQLTEDPFEQFGNWMAAVASEELPLANAMVLSTVDAHGQPSSRVVLLKEVTSDAFVFFTNYESHKGRDLNANPMASLLFWWPAMERQIRIEGRCEKVKPSSSDAYFAARPRQSQLSAAVSRQSERVSSRQELEKAAAQLDSSLAGGPVPRPDFWGGYKLSPSRFEFWQGRPDRLHDRFQYIRPDGPEWTVCRLSP